MAFGVKYRTEFSDELGTDWKVDFQVDPDPGTITTLQASGPSPMTIEWYGDDDLSDSPISGSRMTVEIERTTDFAYSDILEAGNLEMEALVYQNGNLFWKGYVVSESCSEPYAAAPYSISITASDGLGLLKDFQFVDLGYTARTKASVVIYDILSLIGVTSFTEYVNVYGSTMTANVNTSPFDQFGIDPDLYKAENCYDALQEIISLFNACIRQDNGSYIIYRFCELKHTTMYGRIFTTGTTKSSTTKTPAQYLDRPTQSSSFRDLEGGTAGRITRIKKLVANYDLNVRESVLKHYDFQREDFVLTTGVWSIPDWTAVNSVISPISEVLPGFDEGIYLLSNAEFGTDYIKQGIPGVKTRSPQFTLTYDYRFYSETDNDSAYQYYLVYIEGASTKYWNDSTLTWDNSGPAARVVKSNLPLGWSEWETNTIVINSVPIDGTLNVELYAAFGTSKDVNVAYKNVRVMLTPATGSNDAGIGYTVTVSTSGAVKEKSYNLGDGFTSARYTVNQLLNYKGIINGYSGATIVDPGTTWNTYTAGVSNAEGKALLDLIATESGDQYARIKMYTDLPVIETTAGTFLSLTGNIQDVLNQYSGNNRIFGIAKATYDVRSRQYNLTLTEIL